MRDSFQLTFPITIILSDEGPHLLVFRLHCAGCKSPVLMFAYCLNPGEYPLDALRKWQFNLFPLHQLEEVAEERSLVQRQFKSDIGHFKLRCKIEPEDNVASKVYELGELMCSQNVMFYYGQEALRIIEAIRKAIVSKGEMKDLNDAETYFSNTLSLPREDWKWLFHQTEKAE